MKLATVGVGLSLACAVHCLAMPFVAGAACCAAEARSGPAWLEPTMLGTAAGTGALTLGLGWRRHRRWLPFVVLAAGLALVSLAPRLFTGGWATAAATGGALLLATSQLLNRRCCSAPCCDSPPRGGWPQERHDNAAGREAAG
jgi:hypothetical protein